MFGKSELKIFEKWSKIIISFFIWIIISITVIIVIRVNLDKAYVMHKDKQIEITREEVIYVIENNELGDYSDKLLELNKEYQFELLILDKDNHIYSTNGVLTIEEQEELYKNYIHKEELIVKEYVVWLCILTVDMSGYDSVPTGINMLITLLLVSSFIILMIYVIQKVLKPLFRIVKILSNIKSDYEDHHEFDLVVDDLANTIDEINLISYQRRLESLEYEKMYLKQQLLVKEQKQYLESVVHDIKSPFASINQCRYIIEHDSSNYLSIKSNNALVKIREQSEKGLAMIIKALEDVLVNEINVFIDTEEFSVKDYIEEFLLDNDELSKKNCLVTEVKITNFNLNVNKIKMKLLLSNILSNMISYAKVNTTLIIGGDENELFFTNYVANNVNENSTKVGMKLINELCNDLGFELINTIDDELYITKVILKSSYIK